MVTSFDPTDKKYQVSEDFPPDKESTWGYPAEKDGWVRAHNALRKEMADMIDSIRAAAKRGPLQAWEVNCIQTFWEAHYEHIESHHSNEDDLLVPFLKTRFHVPDKVEAEHKDLVLMLKKIGGMVSNLKEGATLDELLKNLVEYETLMKPHLLEEEVECLPMMRAYFTPEEIGPKIGEIIRHGPKIEIGSFIAAMGVEEFRNEFMPQEGIPFFVWYIDFKGRHKLFLKRFANPVKAVKNNQEPQSCFSFFGGSTSGKRPEQAV